mgnify:CR=1 FL=1
MLIWEVEGIKAPDFSKAQSNALQQQQKQLNIRKKQVQLKKARERQQKISTQITKLANKAN